MSPKVYPVIMAGGLGKRLWPISHSSAPKQFCKFNMTLSLFQKAIARNLFFTQNPTVIVNQSHLNIALEQIDELKVKCNIIVETQRNGSGFCAIHAAFLAPPNAHVVLIPADHIINEQEQYQQAIINAIAASAQSPLVTIGIKPSYASQHYGYIKCGPAVAKDSYICQQFIEKPAKIQALKYLNSGKYLWNSGIFVYQPRYFLPVAKRLAPGFFHAAKHVWKNKKMRHNIIHLPATSLLVDNRENSIDYLFMERLKGTITVVGNFEWSDLGNFNNLFALMPKDNNNNYVAQNSLLEDVRNCYVIHDHQQALLMGLENVVVVSRNNCLLVASMDKLDQLKTILEQLDKNDSS
jgi:mannose-1-phosphate guanylyltransferase